MGFDAISHVAIRVPDLRAAEELYVGLFGLELVFREARQDGEWRTYREELTWEEIPVDAPGPELTVLARDGVTIALSAAPPTDALQMLDHVGIALDARSLNAVRRQAPAFGCEIVAEREDLLAMVDPFGIQWELTSSEPKSNGERHGRWIALD